MSVLSVDTLLAGAAESPTARVALPEERATAAELDARAGAFAAHLQARGLRPGAKVAVWLAPSLDLMAALFGTIRAGCVAVPVSDRFRAMELRHVVRHAGVEAVLTTDADGFLDRLGLLRQALPGLGDDAAGLAVADAPRLREIVLAEDVDGAAVSPAPADPGPTALLMFTSGTSAAAKACVISHRALLAHARVLAEDRYLIGASSVVWTPLPLFHIAGIVTLLATLHARATFLHSGMFNTATTLPLLAAERPTHALAAFDTIWLQLLDEAERAATDLSSIEVGLSANGPEQLRRLHARLPRVAFVGNYGSTEGCGHSAIGGADEPEEIRLDGGGMPVPGVEVRITDMLTDGPLPAGEQGEIQLRGPSIFDGYHDDPAANAAAFTDDGWFRTGDLGVVDATGRLFFRGRLKDMLKVGGENVSAMEVEAFLMSHPDVGVAAVVGVPDDYYGEVAAAFVEPIPGAEVGEDDLIAFCAEHIAGFKVPRYVRVVDAWPMSGTKIRKLDLAERLRGELREAGITRAPRPPRRRSGRRAGEAAR